MKKVLILSFAEDLHAQAIQALLSRHGAQADILDTGGFPSALSLVQSGPGDVRLDGKRLTEYHSIWWRRVRAPQPSREITEPEEYRFAARESREALWGAIHASRVPIYNSPQAEERANYKPYQLKVASECGLMIPDTLITNSAEEVARFRSRHDHVIYKTFSGTTLMMTDTRPLTDADMDDLWRLQYAPVIFQEYLERGREYRVTVIEDDLFVAEIGIRNPKAHYDWRLDQTYEVTKTTLPDELCGRLVQLTKALGLNSGSIDLRETPDGRIFFLEINPSGQFLFLDVFGGLETGNRFCQMLLQ